MVFGLAQIYLYVRSGALDQSATESGKNPDSPFMQFFST